MATTNKREEFPFGNELRFKGSFTVGDVPTDPSTVIGAFRHESGAEFAFTYLTDSEVGRSAVGEFHTDWIPTLTGAWWFGIKGTGFDNAVWEIDFFIRASKVNFAA